LGAGVDAQLSRLFVVGAFANFDWSSIDTRGTLHIDSTTVDVSAFELKNAWTVGGRAGVLITSSTMVYGLVGYSWLDFDNLRITAFDSNDGSRGSDSGGGFARVLNEPIRKGITLGGGIEQKITPNLSLKAEYRFTDLGDVDQAIDTVQIDRHSKIQMLRVGAAYRINWRDGAVGNRDQAPVTRTWTGFYGGAGIAVDALVQNASLHAMYDDGSLHVSGLGGGDISGSVTAGYDQQIAARWLIGAFADYDWMGQDFKVHAAGLGDDGSGQASGHLMSLDHSWTAGARAGYLLANDVLAYGLIGFTRAEINDVSISTGRKQFGIRYPSFDGVTIGGGFEKRLTNHISLRAEYRFTDLQEGTLRGDLGAPIVGESDPEIHSAIIGAAYRFP